MREILFKAKLVDEDKWVEFYSIIQLRDMDENVVAVAVIPKGTLANGLETLTDVIPETVCQFINQRDKNGKRIFEGDILSYNDEPQTPDYVVTFGKLRIMYRLKFTDRVGREIYEFSLPEFDHIEITGNIHDTTEATK